MVTWPGFVIVWPLGWSVTTYTAVTLTCVIATVGLIGVTWDIVMLRCIHVFCHLGHDWWLSINKLDLVILFPILTPDWESYVKVLSLLTWALKVMKWLCCITNFFINDHLEYSRGDVLTWILPDELIHSTLVPLHCHTCFQSRQFHLESHHVIFCQNEKFHWIKFLSLVLFPVMERWFLVAYVYSRIMFVSVESEANEWKAFWMNAACNFMSVWMKQEWLLFLSGLEPSLYLSLKRNIYISQHVYDSPFCGNPWTT